MSAVAQWLIAREGDGRTALLFEDQSWTYAEYVQACAKRAAFLLARRTEAPFHVGILLDNVPEFPMWLGATTISGATMVGINPTRQGDDLKRDITHTDCQWIVTEQAHISRLEGLDLPCEIINIDSSEYRGLLEPHEGARLPRLEIDPQDRFMLVFTSGTSGAPKACVCSHGRVAATSLAVAEMGALTDEDVNYIIMPLFHSNSIVAGWAPALSQGGTVALRRRFSASNFLPDVRKFGVTYFNYVGKPLAYILATPEQEGDADNTLRMAFGNEASEQDIEKFSKRFGCNVSDAYGSTEGGIFVVRTAGMPKGSLGVASEDTIVLNVETGEECPRAEFDEQGRLLNANEAIGELVNTSGVSSFEGYWKNEEANRKRVEGGVYHTGDLVYRDAQGFFYFAGRDIEHMRIDGENIATSQVEKVLFRYADVVLAAVFAVPDPVVGDQIMAALQLREGATFCPDGFERFLEQQSDMGTKWTPKFVRIVEQMPLTQTTKIAKQQLRKERWETSDAMWWKSGKNGPYTRMSELDVKYLKKAFIDRGRGDVLDVS